jgi:diaminopimelate decarboxylase
LADVAREMGTPTYVYGWAFVAERLRELSAALGPRSHRICYAVKANGALGLLARLAAAGAGADIVSGGELRRAIAAGFPPERIVFSGVAKRDDELELALRVGIEAFNVESSEELERLAVLASALERVAPVALRVNPDVDAATHPYLATGLREAKFGIPLEDALDLALHVAATPGLQLVGLASHIGSQIHDAAPFAATARALAELARGLAARGVTLRHLDLGGGLGIAYRPGEPRLDVAQWGESLRSATADLSVDLLVEPGRWLVGNCGVLLTRVEGRKSNRDRHFVLVDAGMNDLIRPSLYDAHHVVIPTAGLDRASAEEVVDVVGPVCETGDFLALGRHLPHVTRGDLLVVLGAGAYGFAMASNYNTRPLPAEVLVDGDRWDVLRARQTVDDLLAAERIPPA